MKLQNFPKFTKIDLLSPTLIAMLKKCEFRVALRIAKAEKTAVESKAGILGIIAHAVFENVHSIDLDDLEDLRDHFESIWDSEVQRQEKILRRSKIDRHLLPIRNWKNYSLKRERTIRQAIEIASQPPPPEPQEVTPELWLESEKYGLRGRIDLVVETSDGLILIDYKSGKFPDDQNSQNRKIAEWKQQLLIYAILIEDKFGKFPIYAEIHLLDQTVLKIEISRQEAIALSEFADQLKKEFNAEIERGDQISELANYSEENCRFCEFKGWCDTFWRENSEPPKDQEFGHLSGEVKKITWRGTENVEIEIQTESDQIWQIKKLRLDRFPDLAYLQNGSIIRLLNFFFPPNIPFYTFPTVNSVIIFM